MAAHRSYLFVPADSERKIARALAGEADALILDLEDAVAPERKAAAREACAAFLMAGRAGKPIFVRINGFDTPHAMADLAAVVRGGPDGIMLPKSRDAADLVRLDHHLTALEWRDGLPAGGIAALPIITETAQAMAGLGSYAQQAPRLCGMLWGGEDLAADLGAQGNREPSGAYAPAFALARAQCLIAARAARTEPLDAVFVDFRDHAGLEQEARAACWSGFSGKAAIHPDQVAIINAAFTPTAEELARARAVLAAFDATPDAGAVALDGRMLDQPHRRAALGVLARGRSG